MFKITKASLAQLAQEMRVLADQEQKKCIGGADSTYSQFGSAFRETSVEDFSSVHNPLSTQIGEAESPYASSMLFEVENPRRQHNIFATAFIEELDSAVASGSIGAINGFGSGGIDAYGIESGDTGSGGIDAYGIESWDTGSGGIDAYGIESWDTGSGGVTSYSYTESDDWDPDKAIARLRNSAGKSSSGYCAGAVMNAIEAGGEKAKRVDSAHEMNDRYLGNCGFKEVSKNDYVPQKGDVIVIESVPGHRHGHTAMYDGKTWISDFYQRDAFGSSAYRKPGVQYYYYRHR